MARKFGTYSIEALGGFPKRTLDPAKEFPGQDRHQGTPDIPPLLYRGAWLCSIFPLCAGASPLEPPDKMIMGGCPAAKGASGTWPRLSACPLRVASMRALKWCREGESIPTVPKGSLKIPVISSSILMRA